MPRELIALLKTVGADDADRLEFAFNMLDADEFQEYLDKNLTAMQTWKECNDAEPLP